MEKNNLRNFGIVLLGVFFIIWGVMTWFTGLSQGGGKVSVEGWEFGHRAFLVSDNFFENFRFYVFCSIPIVVGVGILMKRNLKK